MTVSCFPGERGEHLVNSSFPLATRAVAGTSSAAAEETLARSPAWQGHFRRRENPSPPEGAGALRRRCGRGLAGRPALNARLPLDARLLLEDAGNRWFNGTGQQRVRRRSGEVVLR